MSHKPDQFSKGTKVTVGKTDLATCDLDVRPRNRVVSYVHIPPLIDGLFLFAERPASAERGFRRFGCMPLLCGRVILIAGDISGIKRKLIEGKNCLQSAWHGVAFLSGRPMAYSMAGTRSSRLCNGIEVCKGMLSQVPPER